MENSDQVVQEKQRCHLSPAVTSCLKKQISAAADFSTAGITTFKTNKHKKQ